MQAEDVGKECRRRSTAQHARHAFAQRARVPSIEVEEERPLQGQGVARMRQEDPFPVGAGAGPVTRSDALDGMEVLVRDRSPGRERPGSSARAACASATSEASVRPSRKPAFMTRGSSQAGSAAMAASSSLDGRAVERHQPPERLLAEGQRLVRRRADGVALRVAEAHAAESCEGAFKPRAAQATQRGAGRIASQARATCSTPRSSCRLPAICRPIGSPAFVQLQLMSRPAARLAL